MEGRMKERKEGREGGERDSLHESRANISHTDTPWGEFDSKCYRHSFKCMFGRYIMQCNIRYCHIIII